MLELNTLRLSHSSHKIFESCERKLEFRKFYAHTKNINRELPGEVGHGEPESGAHAEAAGSWGRDCGLRAVDDAQRVRCGADGAGSGGGAVGGDCDD